MDDRALCFFPLHLPMSPQSASAYNWDPSVCRISADHVIVLSSSYSLIDISFVKTAAALAREITLPAAPLATRCEVRASIGWSTVRSQQGVNKQKG
jgi:hypothetical protein